MIKKLLYFFNKRQKKYLLLLFGFMLISAILEMVGLGFIFSIVGVLNPTSIKDSILINKLGTFLELSETKIIYVSNVYSYMSTGFFWSLDSVLRWLL